MIRMTTITVMTTITTTATIILIALQASLSTETTARTLIFHQLPSQKLCQIVCQLARQVPNHHLSQNLSQIPSSQMSTVIAMIWWPSLLIFTAPTTVTLITIQIWIVIVMTMSMVERMVPEVSLPSKAITTSLTIITITTTIATAIATMALKERLMKASITLLPMVQVERSSIMDPLLVPQALSHYRSPLALILLRTANINGHGNCF